MRDIVERFRTEMRETLDASAEKSAEIKRLKAENEKLRAALIHARERLREDGYSEEGPALVKINAALTQQEGER